MTTRSRHGASLACSAASTMPDRSEFNQRVVRIYPKILDEVIEYLGEGRGDPADDAISAVENEMTGLGLDPAEALAYATAITRISAMARGLEPEFPALAGFMLGVRKGRLLKAAEEEPS